MTTLEDLRFLNGPIYLASPYSKYPMGLETASWMAELAAGKLMRMGFPIFCPIAHSHHISRTAEIDPMDWQFWKKVDLPMMAVSAALIVLKLETWEESIGVAEEIAYFTAAGKPVVYVTPSEIGL